jgi:hypothetical protein
MDFLLEPICCCMKRLIEIKILPETYQLLRMVAALKNERQYHVLHRLLQAEADRALKEKLEHFVLVELPPYSLTT